MKGFFILLLALIQNSFSGELSGGDKIELGSVKFGLLSIKKGEVTGAEKPIEPETKVIDKN